VSALTGETFAAEQLERLARGLRAGEFGLRDMQMSQGYLPKPGDDGLTEYIPDGQYALTLTYVRKEK
jgi:hypothetical protein